MNIQIHSKEEKVGQFYELTDWKIRCIIEYEYSMIGIGMNATK